MLVLDVNVIYPSSGPSRLHHNIIMALLYFMEFDVIEICKPTPVHQLLWGNLSKHLTTHLLSFYGITPSLYKHIVNFVIFSMY